MEELLKELSGRHKKSDGDTTFNLLKHEKVEIPFQQTLHLRPVMALHIFKKECFHIRTPTAGHNSLQGYNAFP